MIQNIDCIQYMKGMEPNSIDFTLTDIPYEKACKSSNGLRELDKKTANTITFPLEDFLSLVYRVTRNSLVIFCGIEQFSNVFDFFEQKEGTARPIIWEKTNPSPMNGEYVYLSAIEHGVWFKKKGASTFNAFCKSNVFRFPCGTSKEHPTEKNHKLIEALILDNTNQGDTVFDPCCGSGTHLMIAKKLGRKILGCELNPEYYEIAKARLYNPDRKEYIYSGKRAFESMF